MEEFKHIIEKMEQEVMFIDNYKPFDFTQGMGQYALEINYTNGDMDMLTTPMSPTRGSDKGDFKDKAEMFSFIESLSAQGIKRG